MLSAAWKVPSPTRAKNFRHFTAKSLGLKHDGQGHGWVGPRMAASCTVTWKLYLGDFYALGL